MPLAVDFEIVTFCHDVTMFMFFLKSLPYFATAIALASDSLDDVQDAALLSGGMDPDGFGVQDEIHGGATQDKQAH